LRTDRTTQVRGGGGMSRGGRPKVKVSAKLEGTGSEEARRLDSEVKGQVFGKKK